MTRIMGALHEDQYTTLTLSHSVLHRMRNVSGKICRENQKIFCSIFFFFFCKIGSIYEMMQKIAIEPHRPPITIWYIHIACWIPKAAYTLIICNTYCFSTATMMK
jgi:hypothetical protein